MAPRVSNRRVLLVAVSLLAVAALVLSTLGVVDLVRGGTRSPQTLASALGTALDRGRLPRLLALVQPEERPALQRLSEGLSRDAQRFGLRGDAGPDALSLDGLRLDLTGVSARAELVSADLAVLTFDRGQVRVRTEPAKTTGVVAGYLGLRRITGPGDARVDLGSSGPAHSGWRVLAVRREGRWYVSLLMTLLERQLDAASDPTTGTGGRLAVPAAPAGERGGFEDPEEAAVALTRALVAVPTAADVSALAATLDSTGALAVNRYAPLFFSDDQPVTWGVQTAVFDSTRQGPDRAVVRIRSLILTSADGRQVDLGPRCVAGGTRPRCLHDNTYRYDGHPSVGWFDLLGPDGTFALTAVRQDGRWRIGLADSLADRIVAGVGALSREQALALLHRVPLTEPTAQLVPGRPRQIAFTSAGYATAALHVDRAGLYRIMPSPTGYQRGTVYAADGQPAPQKYFPNDDSYDLVGGDYTVLVWADEAFTRVLDGRVAGPYRQRVEVRRVLGS